jgi:beta-phosphoglucomutase-like phosphatase (HAD superfamily)
MGFRGAIFDVDGVLVDSPHVRAWRQALRELMEGEWRDIRAQTTYTPELFTPAVYQAVMAGKFHAFPDALRLVLAVKGQGIPLAAASSSKNADLFLKQIRLDLFAAERGLPYDFIEDGMTLLDLFDADISGRDFEHGKPHPMIFLTGASELGVPPESCFVVEDAASGVQAAKAGNMAALGIARMNDRPILNEAGADLVVTSLDDVAINALAEARLERATMR